MNSDQTVESLQQELDNLRQQYAKLESTLQQRDRLLSFLKLPTDLLCVANLTGHLLQINEAWESTLGFNEAELKAVSFLEFVHPDDRAATATMMERLAKGESIVDFENRFRCKDGSYRWFVWTAVPQVGDRTCYAISRDITSRKQAEAELLLYKHAVESSSDAIVIADADGFHVYLNAAFIQLFECETVAKFTASGGIAACFTSPDDAEMVIQAMLAGRSWQGELEQRSRQGRVFQAHIRTDAIKDAAGKVVGLLCTITDISDSKQTEQTLRKQIEMLDLASDAIVIRDMAGAITYWNQGAEALYGWRKAEAYGQITHKLLRTGFPDSLEQMMACCDRSGKWEGELVHLTRDRRQIVVQSRWTLQRDSAGQPVAVLEISTDITEQKLAEEALRQSEAQLQTKAQREQLLNQLSRQIRSTLDIDQILETSVQEIHSLLAIDCIHFALYRADAEAAFWEIVNEAKTATTTSLLGNQMPLVDIAPLSEKILSKQILWVDDVSMEKDPVLKGLLLSFGFLAVLAIPVHTQSGTVGALICEHFSNARPWQADEVELIQAVTDQLAIAIDQANLYQQSRNKTQELEALLEELQQTQTQLVQSEKMSSLGQLVAGVAHEINNPVNFIYGNLTHANTYIQDLLGLIQLYQKYYPNAADEIQAQMEAIDLEFLTADLPSLLGSMKVGADRIQKIVASLRNFSRMDEAEFKVVDIHEGIDSTLMILQNRLKARLNHPEIQLIKHYAELPLIECYPGQLNQVFMNILANAIDALEEQNQNRTLEDLNQNPSQIEIRTELVDAEQVRIWIKDNGPGIAKEVQQRLFDPFFTTKSVGKGTGLGMSISYQIVTEKHRGSLQCFSVLGQGAEFAIEIPIKQAPVS